VQTIKIPFRDAIDVVRGIDAFAVEPNGGLLVLPGVFSQHNRELIISLAARHRLPAIYSSRADVAAGGLMAYASDPLDRRRGAAAYVDRLLRGAKVSELPVQFPTKMQPIINLKAAKAIGSLSPRRSCFALMR
jgi:putative ABC transport system substrate-binding protein